MKATHLAIYTTLFALLSTPTVSQAQARSEKDYFRTMDPRARLELIANMRVKRSFKPLSEIRNIEEDDKDNQTDKIDIAQYLTEKCGFNYQRTAAGIQRPQVQCTYTPKSASNPFNGMTAKFDCSFDAKQDGGKKRVLKVKYEPKRYAGGGHKEIPQAVMGTLMARMMGFYSSTYCPVDVVCNDCPSENPWEQKSQAPAAIGNRVLFENVVVEIKQKGFQVTDSRNTNTDKPQGFSFRNEMARYAPRDRALQAQLLTEREALAIWMNFVRSQDADHHNNKLYCLKSTVVEGSNPKCDQSIGVINDYGNAFGYSKADRPLKLSDFSRDTLMSGSGRITAWGASGNSGAGGYTISQAGRDLFVSMAESLSDNQLEDIFQLAQVEKVSDGDSSKWKEAYRHKVQRIKNFRFR
ncbi:hypothetical protein [Pseudobdellovibrio exovorus]|uniref:Uncharacterized protein n=1 Tax=Pseudobdellovibrio exovorus JSS TaxID=1184267 RepID=M4VNH2_9BACT|nr:hypothetical protein [Pseudobdellovibrio exovorus]AGH94649.1 hypothetical protein A11Q_429 [Pseudobdellovibrio exovorus JSS]